MTEHNEQEHLQQVEPVNAVEAEAEPAPQATEPEAESDAPQQELEQLRAQSQEYLDGWQRARAELSNARRRFEKERAEAGQYANAELIRKLLPVGDDFERALAAIPEDKRNPSWVEGIFMIHRKFQVVLDSVGVQVIPVQPGDTFDPEKHQAVTHEATQEYPSGSIIAEVQKGYKMGNAVLRPSLVRVAQ